MTTVTVRERGILFSASMVQALLAGRKTQTRRVVKPQPIGEARPLKEWAVGLADACHVSPSDTEYADKAASLRGKVFPFRRPGSDTLVSPTCPYGQPGDVLWVRETFAVSRIVGNKVQLNYMADDRLVVLDDVCHDEREWARKYERRGPRPSLFMPRWASRITLEITDVRVERVTQISEEDALAEGIEELEQGPLMERFWTPDGDEGHHSAVHAYAELWDSINGKKHPWASNPFVWAITFKRAEARQ